MDEHHDSQDIVVPDVGLEDTTTTTTVEADVPVLEKIEEEEAVHVLEKGEEGMEVVDEDEHLKLYCFRTCTESDTDEWKMKRSVVKDKDGNTVAVSLPYTDEYVVRAGEAIPDLDVVNEYDVYPSIEGTLMRVFQHHGKWYISTNRKLDAFKSYWSSHFSFGQLFVNNVLHVFKDNNVESFFQRLEATKVYFFLLRPTVESRIVCQIDTNSPSLYFLGALDTTTQEQGHTLALEANMIPEIPRVSRLTIQTMDEIKTYVQDVNVWEYQGVILFHKQKNKQVKILNDHYKYLWSIRNNNPNLFLRYFEIRTDPKMLEDFFKLYPKFVTVADRFEYQIFEVSKHLHQAYVDRYIRKQYVSLPKQEYVILKKAHDWHNLDRNFNRIYRTKMLQLLNEEKPIHLYQIIKRHFKY